jgi:hypothetical protein
MEENFDPADALRLIKEQRAEAARRLNPDLRWYYWPWGVAWLVGFALFFLRYGPDGRIFVHMPGWLPGVALGVGLVGAAVASALASVRASGQVTGDSAKRGAWYGLAWFLGFTSLGVTLAPVTGHLPAEQQGLVWAASSVALTGALHMAGGAVWLDRNLFTLGVWITIVNIVGVIAGPGWHSLVVSLAAGGGMLVTGAVLERQARARARA